MDIIFTFSLLFGLFFLFGYLFQTFFKVPSYQLRIQPSGLKKIPKLLLKLAKVEKDGNVTWQDLNKIELGRVSKYYKKLENTASIELTFLYSQNLIHIQLTDKSYLFPMDKNQNYLVQEQIGRLDKDIYVEFVIYRRPRGWFKSPILIGYLKKDRKYLPQEDKDKEIEILFEFPEALVKRTFFTKVLENKFKLKKTSDVLGGYKNELGDEEPYWSFSSYDQEYHSGSNFNFLIHS